jgi:hypothetical protein
MNNLTRTGTISGFTRNTVIINGVCLHYLLGGNPNGSPVLLWHGFLRTGCPSNKGIGDHTVGWPAKGRRPSPPPSNGEHLYVSR